MPAVASIHADQVPQSETSAESTSPALDLTVLVATDGAAVDHDCISRLHSVLGHLSIRYEILPIPAIAHRPPGYGEILFRAAGEAKGVYVLTMNGDASHPPEFIEALWHRRHDADLLIASRLVDGGQMPGVGQHAFSRFANAIVARGLDVPVRDWSSGFRLYRCAMLRELDITCQGNDALQQSLILAFAEGYRVLEIPCTFHSEPSARTSAAMARDAIASLRTFGSLWLLRNSILSADYDDRAHDSRIFLQRYWQRSRHRFVMELVAGQGPVLDIGCGSSRIIGALPPGSVAVDILHRKLRYARRFNKPLVRSSGFALPFPDQSFPCVLCSQVIEHVPKDSPILDELCRVLAPGGRLVLGTPDYANWQWVWIERLYGLVPGGYKDEHISHYTNRELVRIMGDRGLKFEEERYILRGELIQAFRKPA